MRNGLKEKYLSQAKKKQPKHLVTCRSMLHGGQDMQLRQRGGALPMSRSLNDGHLLSRGGARAAAAGALAVAAAPAITSSGSRAMVEC